MKGIPKHNLPILLFLKELAPESSHNTLRSWIAKGRVSIAGKVVDRSNHPVRAGQEVIVGPRVQFTRANVKILFEDEHLIAVEKPAGLLSVATDFHKEYTVHTILKQRLTSGRVFPVHRLDRATSGVMLFAYTEQARDRMKEQFEKRTIEKLYVAIVQGKLSEKKGVWQSYLEEDAQYFVASTPSATKGKLAITYFEVIGQNSRYTALKLKLQTGRKNQLRVHCAEAGFPIVGDKKYGATANPIQRLCLHAQSIAFDHPISHKRMCFTSAVPLPFHQLLPLTM